MSRAFEDYRVGDVQTFGRYAVTREEVLEFARRFDPSPHHLDDHAAAANPMFGRISASGAHSIAMLTRMMVDHWDASGQRGMGSPGFSVRFLKPVFPGDVLSCELLVTDCVPSRSRPQVGAVHFIVTLRREDGTAVLELSGTSFHARRAGQDGEAPAETGPSS